MHKDRSRQGRAQSGCTSMGGASSGQSMRRAGVRGFQGPTCIKTGPDRGARIARSADTLPMNKLNLYGRTHLGPH